MKHFLISGFIIFICLQAHSQDITKDAVQKAISEKNLEHPFLLFNKTDKQAILTRIDNDPESQAIMERLLAEANMLLFQPVDTSIPTRATNVRAGWSEADRDNEYERKLNLYTKNAEKLAFVYQITGENEYASKSYEFVEVVCKMPVWISQAHEFDIIYNRVWPWNVDEDQVNFNSDIGSATRGRAVALVYDWIYEALTKHQRDRIKGALLEKVITPVRGDYDFHWWATSYRCNWTGVCNSGIGMVALALIKDYPQLSDVIAESHNRIDRMMNELGVDGGWQEGGGYWKYGMDNSLEFAYALNKLTDKKFNLFENEKVKANPVTFPIYLFVPPNKSVNFGDSGDEQIGGTSFFNLLVNETKSAEGAWYREHVLGAGQHYMDLIFPRPSVEPKLPKNSSKHFSSIDWWVMRSDFTDPSKVTIAGKAGKHDDPHHGHLDVGHFILYWKGEDFLKDSGRPYYDEEYFDELRWQYPQSSSGGHNTVLVNGQQQVAGKLKNKPFDYDIGGKVLVFESSEKQDYVLMDATNAYPKKELEQWRRHITLKKPDITIILDEVTAAKPNSKVEVRFHSGARIETHNKYVLLNGKKGKMALIPVADHSLQIVAGQHAYQPIHGKKPFEWLPYFDVEVVSDKKTVKVATLVIPVKDGDEALMIANSIKMISDKQSSNVSFKYREKDHQFEFTTL